MLLYRGVALFKLRNASDALRDLRSATSLDASLSATATAWINLASAQLEEDEKRADAAASALVLEDARIERKKKSRRQKRRNRKKNRVVRTSGRSQRAFNIEVLQLSTPCLQCQGAVLGNYKSDEIDEALALRMRISKPNSAGHGSNAPQSTLTRKLRGGFRKSRKSSSRETYLKYLTSISDNLCL